MGRLTSRFAYWREGLDWTMSGFTASNTLPDVPRRRTTHGRCCWLDFSTGFCSSSVSYGTVPFVGSLAGICCYVNTAH